MVFANFLGILVWGTRSCIPCCDKVRLRAISANWKSNLPLVVSSAIEKDPVEYNDLVLGRPKAEYIDWIRQPNSWGGAIELAIFSDYYQTGTLLRYSQMEKISLMQRLLASMLQHVEWIDSAKASTNKSFSFYIQEFTMMLLHWHHLWVHLKNLIKPHSTWRTHVYLNTLKRLWG